MNNRNYSIDVLKFVLAIMVVIIHTGDWFAHQALMPLARSAVPCFFMISGYLLYSRVGIGRERLMRNVRHIGVMCAWTLVLFSVVDVTRMLYNHTMNLPTAVDAGLLLVFNHYPWPVGGHLWYLLAYLYVLIIMLAVDKFRLWHLLFVSAPLLFAAYFWTLHHGMHEYVYRNFLLEGLPCFAVGAMVKHWRHRITGRIDRKLFAGGAVFFLLSAYAESCLTGEFCNKPVRESYFSTPFLALFILLFAIATPTTKPNWFSRMGCDYSTCIYIFHMLFVYVFYLLTSRYLPLVSQTVYQYISPLVILVCCVAMTWTLRRMGMKI